MILISFSIILLNKVPEVGEDNTVKSKDVNNDRKNTVKSLVDIRKNKMYLKYLIIISIIWGTQNADSE